MIIPISIYKNIIVLVTLLFFSLAVGATSITDNLNQAEYLLHRDIKSAVSLLQNTQAQIKSASDYQKIRWLFLSMDSAVFSFDSELAKTIVSQSQLLLSPSNQETALWQHILEVGLYITADKYNLLLPHLENIEQAVRDSNNVRLNAHFNRILHYAYLSKGITDLALDTALQNRSEWLALEEDYYALDMLFQTVELYANFGNTQGARDALVLVKSEAKKLKASSLLIASVSLEANILASEGKVEQSFMLLNKLIEDENIDHNHDRYLNITSNIAFISYDLKQYENAIKYARIILEIEPKSVAIKVLLAKALIELKQFNEASSLLIQAEKIYLAQHDHYGLFDIDNAKIDLLYQRGDIDALYTKTKSLINRIVNFDDQQSQKRVERAHIIANADQQAKVVNTLAENNIAQKKEITSSKELIALKNNYLVILSIACFILVGLFIWLVKLLKKVKKLANTDSLTGIYNRRAGLKKARKILKKNSNNNNKGIIAVAIMDLDYFKAINDTYGHDIGDKVIQATVSTTGRLLSKDDLFCRMGGEEFMIIISENSQPLAIGKFNLLREGIFHYPHQTLGLQQAISASFGVSFFDNSASDKSLTDYIIKADLALYKAKEAGRNKVIVS